MFTFLSTFLLQVYKYDDKQIVIMIIMITTMMTTMIPYMQKTCDVTEKAILAKKNLRKKCVNRDKM